MVDRRQHEAIRQEFGKQARHFGEQGLTLSSQEHLRWMVDAISPEATARVLDVAAGTGHLARALAPHVRSVVAVDLTPEMLAEGRREAAAAGLANVVFEEGLAERLRYGDGAFDLVVTRLSVHHFADPAPAVREMARVCRSGGTVAVVDLLSPDDQSLAARYNELERLRDPSHTRALTGEELVALVKSAGLQIVGVDARTLEVDAGRWLAMTHASEAVGARVLDALAKEIAGGAPTGMRPYRRGEEMKFLHTWAVVVATKTS